MGDRKPRAQLSLSIVESGIGVVLILGVTMGFALGVPAPHTRGTQLDMYAKDAGNVLMNDAPRHQGTTRLAEIIDSSKSFRREKGTLEHRVDRILPDNLMFRVETPYGSVGYRKPAGVPVGHSTVTTANGDVTVWVWYV
ncbi:MULTISPECIES: hypothetical protein [unclassified Haladaptatus]|uniref:DUF7262 family protein n=1 Tax=unclassified Haladaptatus TaxID=2622732 RepID=UPI00209C4108|nr:MULTISPECIES: hypothetical protein [unclassified Haladaptatus]MCO8246536.1 hypothetical protein [Haladaptatus sp. AB643]MCO8254774.1 hypothetical protein [Haladaptatus sp. AB618]